MQRAHRVVLGIHLCVLSCLGRHDGQRADQFLLDVNHLDWSHAWQHFRVHHCRACPGQHWLALRFLHSVSLPLSEHNELSTYPRANYQLKENNAANFATPEQTKDRRSVHKGRHVESHH